MNDGCSAATCPTATGLLTSTLVSSTLTTKSLHINQTSELVQKVLRKFQLQPSDYLFLENILRVLEREQNQRID